MRSLSSFLILSAEIKAHVPLETGFALGKKRK